MQISVVASTWKRWQHFGVSLLVNLALPLLPLGSEWLTDEKIGPHAATLTATAAVTTVLLSAEFDSFLAFFFCVIAGFSMTVIHAASQLGRKIPVDPGLWSVYCIALVYIFHIVSRARRHLADGEPFLRFSLT